MNDPALNRAVHYHALVTLLMKKGVIIEDEYDAQLITSLEAFGRAIARERRLGLSPSDALFPGLTEGGQ